MEFNFFDLLLESTFVLDHRGTVIYLNPEAERIFGISKSEALCEKYFLDLIHFDDDLNELIKSEKRKETIPYKESHFTTSCGKKGRVQVALQPYTTFDSENKSKDPDSLKPTAKNQFWIVYLKNTQPEIKSYQKYKIELQEQVHSTGNLPKTHEELERYSKTLEHKVKVKTAEFENLNATMRALLDSLDQGFFIFDKHGKCLSVHSRSCENLLDLSPANLPFWDAIKADINNAVKIQKWIESLFSETLPFKDLVSLGPDHVFNAYNRSLFLNYFPINDANSKLESVVVVVTDKTELEVAEKAAERERAYSHMVINVVRRKKEITHYIFDVQKLLSELNEVLSDHYKFQLQTALRCLHTIKGGATTFAIYDLAQSCHDTEQLLLEVQSEGLSKNNLYILQSHFNKVRYEFQTFLKSNEVLLGNEVIHGKRSVEIPLETITNFLNNLRTETKLNELVLSFEKDIFYVPIIQFLEGFEETIQALAMKLGKKIKPLVVEGGNTLIHREHYSELFTTLIHQLTNIVDHGIESPVLRRFHHKEEFGVITIKVHVEKTDLNYNESALVIRILDDGQGLDPIKIRERLRTKGIATNLLSDNEVLQFIFKGDLSNREHSTLTSGNGLGMEAIMHTVKDLGGTAKIESALLKGTTLVIKVPYITEQFKLVS